MEIITMESSAYKELLEKIEKIAGYVRESERERAKAKETAEVWLDNREVTALLCISRRTLQRLRESGRIGYSIFRGACRYPFSELERLIKESTFNCNPRTLEEFRQNYLLRTGNRVAREKAPESAAKDGPLHSTMEDNSTKESGGSYKGKSGTPAPGKGISRCVAPSKK